jgi:8-oxo-dGTP diphosphatase
LNSSAAEAVRENIVDAAWLSPDEFSGKTVFPPMLHGDYCKDKQQGFAFPSYGGLREMEFD